MKLALALALVASTAAADTLPADPANLPKKDRERLAKTLDKSPPPPVGKKPALLINLKNEWTNDWLAVDPAAPPTGDTVNVFLRDHYTNEPSKMDPKLLGIVLSAAKAFKQDSVRVISAFRHPKYNLMLRKKGHQVARDSQHTHGNAIDFAIPNVTTPQLHAWAKAQHIGGVGIYLSSGFVHMDTGPIRFWSGD